MSASTVSNPSSSVTSTGGSSTPWGWIVWNDPQWQTAIPLWSGPMGNIATVGRALSCTVIIFPEMVGQSLIRRISREHCTLWSSLGLEPTVVINTAENDSFVDGKRVEYHQRLCVDHGSVIAFCSADSQAIFTYYDNYLSQFDYHFLLTNRYLVMNVLAGGTYGDVCRAIAKQSNAIVAVKTVRRSNRRALQFGVTVNTRYDKALENAIGILSELEHPCIVKMLDSSVDRLFNSTYLVMELACGGDLKHKLFAVGNLSEQTAKYFFIQMVSAIKYCHTRSPPIAHRDLNPANVLLTDSSDFAGVKITDFGLAKRVTCPSSMTTFCGTDLYMAPEVRRHKDDNDADPYTPAVDIWSLGVMLHYMLFGRHPACARANHTGLSTSTERSSGSSNAPGVTVSEPARSLIDGMAAIDVVLRHSLEDVIGCQWVRDEDTLAQLREKVFKDTPIF